MKYKDPFFLDRCAILLGIIIGIIAFLSGCAHKDYIIMPYETQDTLNQRLLIQQQLQLIQEQLEFTKQQSVFNKRQLELNKIQLEKEQEKEKKSSGFTFYP